MLREDSFHLIARRSSWDAGNQSIHQAHNDHRVRCKSLGLVQCHYSNVVSITRNLGLRKQDLDVLKHHFAGFIDIDEWHDQLPQAFQIFDSVREPRIDESLTVQRFKPTEFSPQMAESLNEVCSPW